MLFDFMALFNVVDWALQQQDFAHHAQIAQSHGLDDAALSETLDRFIKAELLTSGTQVPPGGRQMRFFGLTARGGDLWERERRPDWNKYCFAFVEPDVRVFSTSRVTAEAYIEVAQDCGLLRCDVSSMSVVCHEPAQQGNGIPLVPWKQFPVGYEISLRAVEGVSVHIDRIQYEARRSWWLSVNELISLQHN